MADDYFAAMGRIEQRMEVVPQEVLDDTVVKVQDNQKAFELTEALVALPQLSTEARLSIAAQLRELLAPEWALVPAASIP